MKRPRHALPAALLLFAGLLLFGPIGCQKAAPPEGEEEPKASVKAVAAERASLDEYMELLGTTQSLPQHAARVAAPVEGHVLWALSDGKGTAVVEGQHVEKGQVIVQLDDRIVRANRAKSQGLLDDLKAQIKQADIAVQLAQLERDRLEKLLPGGTGAIPLVSKVELEKASLVYKDAEAKRNAVLAKEKSLRAELEAMDVQIEFHKLRTPIAGQLGTVQAVPGQTLAIGATVAEVIDLDKIDVLCFVPARAVARLRLDQVALFRDVEESMSDAEKVEGHIVFISDQAQAETGTVAVKARFPNRARRLRANTLVRLQVQTRHKDDCLSIPEEALLEDQEKTAVLVVETKKEKNEKGEEEEKQVVHRFQVELGVRDRAKRKVEILGLIDAKEKKLPVEKDMLFVKEGGHGLEDDDEVTLKKEEEHEEHKEGEAKKEEHKEGEK